MVFLFGLSAEALTEAGLDSQGLAEMKGGKVAAVEVSEVGEEEEETDPNFLPRSWMQSWMLTMPRSLFVLSKIIFILYFEHTEFS